MTAGKIALALVLAWLTALSTLAGCIKLPNSSESSQGPSGTNTDFGWKGSAGLGHGIGGHVDVATPHLQVLLGDPAASGLRKWTPPIDSSLTAFDVDGDGVDELMGLSNDTNVYVFNVKTGEAVATIPTTVRAGWYIERELNPVSAGVLRPGEPVSLVIADQAAYLAVWRFVPAQSSADHFEFEKVWEKRLNTCNPEPSMDSAAVLADLNGDGALEILAQTEEVGDFAFNADGSSLWRQCWAGGNSAPVVDDLDGDGKVEAIFAADDGYVSVLQGSTGAVEWTFDTTTLGITPASVSVSPTVADLDGQSPKEIIFTARDAPNADPARFTDNHMLIVALHASPATNWEPQVVWYKQPAWANPLSYTRLVVRDVDGDGRPDIFGMDWNTIGHLPGNWERIGPAHAFRLDADGNDVWVQTVDAWWSNKDVTLGDANGDGTLDLLVNGPYVGQDGFWILNAANGEQKAFLPAGGWKVLRGAQLMDLSHDGKVQLVLPVEPVDPGDYRGAILVIDLGVRAQNADAGLA